MIKIIKSIIPKLIKRIIRRIIKIIKYTYRYYKIKKPIRQNKPIKIIVGAAETHQPGWYSTNQEWLDICNTQHWEKTFKGKKVLTHIVAEHVFEHLTPDQTKLALRCMYDHLINGGRLRIAVPDGYHPDKTYIEHVNINGTGDDASDHKQLLNVEILSKLLTKTGFSVVHLEGYKKNGQLIQQYYSRKDGYIMRSRINKDITAHFNRVFTDANTSLIIDGIKKI